MIMTIRTRIIFPKRTRTTTAILGVVHKALIRLWRDSVKEFIIATADAMSVDTGMSIASLQPLGAKVGFATLIRESLRGKGPKRGHSKAHGAFSNNNAPFKSRALGERLGRDAFDLEFGTPNVPVLKFTFKIVVLQHRLNDAGLGNVPNPPMWRSIEKGTVAFKQFFNENLPRRLPGRAIARMLLTGRVFEL